MDSAALFNIFVVAAFWCAIGIFGLALAIAAFLIGVRLRADARARQTRSLVERWRAIFLEKAPAPTCPIASDDAFGVLQLWNDFVRTDREGRSARLRAVAEACRLDDACGPLLRGRRGARVVGLTFAGSLGATAHLDAVLDLRGDRIGEVSLAAHRAALRCGGETVEQFLAAVEAHRDWRSRGVEEILVEIGYVGPNPDPNKSAYDRRAVERRPVGALRADA